MTSIYEKNILTFIYWRMSMKKSGLFFLCAAITGYADGAPTIVEQNIHGLPQPRNAPHIEKGSWLFGADFLYWQAQVDNLEFGIFQDITVDTAALEFDASQRSLRLTNSWDPGFRVSLGYHGDQNPWDISLTYTYMHNTARGSKNITGEETGANGNLLYRKLLRPGWVPAFLGDSAITAKARYTLNYNIVDLPLGRNFFISRTLAIHPFFGLRGAFLNQDYTAHYTAVFSMHQFNGTLVDFPPVPTRFGAENTYNAVGLRGGTDLLWHWANNWALLGKASASVLYGKFHIKEKVIGRALTSDGIGAPAILPLTQTDNESYWRTRANMEAYVGLQWEMFFWNKRHIALNLGYEIAHWFQQNEWNDLVSDSVVAGGGMNEGIQGSVDKIARGGDLGLQGLTFNLAFDY